MAKNMNQNTKHCLGTYGTPFTIREICVRCAIDDMFAV